MPTVGPPFEPGPAGAPVEPLPMRPTPPVVGFDPDWDGGMLPIAPEERSVPVPLAALPGPVPPAPEVGQSALAPAAWPDPPLPVRSGGQLVAPLPELADVPLPLVPEDDAPELPVRPGSTELPEPMVPELMPDVLLVGVCAIAGAVNASAANAAVNALNVGFMMIPPVPDLVVEFCKKRAVRWRG